MSKGGKERREGGEGREGGREGGEGGRTKRARPQAASVAGERYREREIESARGGRWRLWRGGAWGRALILSLSLFSLSLSRRWRLWRGGAWGRA